jgi:hypothetical protein
MCATPDISTTPQHPRGGWIRKLVGTLLIALPIVLLFTWLAGRPRADGAAVLQIQASFNPSTDLFPARPDPEELRRLTTLAAIEILGPSILDQAVQDPDLQASDWCQKNPDAQHLRRELRKHLHVRTEPAAGLLFASFRNASPREAALIANVVTRKYIDHLERNYRASLSSRLEALTTQQSDTKRMLQQIRTQKETFMTSEVNRWPVSGTGIQLAAEKCLLIAAEQTRRQIDAGRTEDAAAGTPAMPTSPAPLADTPTKSSPPVPVDDHLQALLEAAQADLRFVELRTSQMQSLIDEELIILRKREDLERQITSVALAMSLSDYGLVRLVQTARPEEP